jgi:hypothetical protein
MFIKFYPENLIGNVNLVDLGVNGRNILSHVENTLD